MNKEQLLTARNRLAKLYRPDRFMDRLYLEYAQLDDRLARLKYYLHDNIGKTPYILLLTSQKDVMEEYLHILKKRIEQLESDNTN